MPTLLDWLSGQSMQFPGMSGGGMGAALGLMGQPDARAEVVDRFNNSPAEPSVIGSLGQAYRALMQQPAPYGDREGAINQAMPLAQIAFTGGMPMAQRGAVGMAGGRLPTQPQFIEPASNIATKYLKEGDLALALARADSSPTAARVPGYLDELKTEIVKQAHPKEVQRVKDLELAQERLGGDLYGGEPRGLVNWLRLQSRPRIGNE